MGDFGRTCCWLARWRPNPVLPDETISSSTLSSAKHLNPGASHANPDSSAPVIGNRRSAEDGGLLPGLISAPLLLPVSIDGTRRDGWTVTLFARIVPAVFHWSSWLVERQPWIPANNLPNERDRLQSSRDCSGQRGYATITIMRRGFGLSGGDYSEKLQQACDYLPAVRNSGDDILAAIATIRREPWVDPDHILLLGHSTGGLAVLAAATANPSGVVGLLNFDGGRHSTSMSGGPCDSDHLISTVAAAWAHSSGARALAVRGK